MINKAAGVRCESLSPARRGQLLLWKAPIVPMTDLKLAFLAYLPSELAQLLNLDARTV